MKTPEQYRIKDGPFGSQKEDGNNGCFSVGPFNVIASDGMGWEHVSVSLLTRCPTWGEMCMIKDLFWDEEECVVQFHPPKSVYVNNHPNVLHLWKTKGKNIETPPTILVGIK